MQRGIILFIFTETDLMISGDIYTHIHTLYYQKFSLTHPNNWNQVFQSLPWPQVYKSKHLGMQTVSTNICERMGRSQELSEFQRGTVIGCHLCNKSSREISSLLNIPQSTVSGIITKWKRLGMTAAQPWSGRPRKMTEQGQWMLLCIVHRGRQLSAESIATDLQTSCGLQISSRTVKCFMEWVSMAEQLHPIHTSASAMQSVRCSEWSTQPLDSRAVETCSLEWWIALLHLAIWWASLGLAVARRTVLVWLHCAKCKVWWRDHGVGLFFRSWARPLRSSGRNSECVSIPRDVGQFIHTCVYLCVYSKSFEMFWSIHCYLYECSCKQTLSCVSLLLSVFLWSTLIQTGLTCDCQLQRHSHRWHTSSASSI